MSSPQKQSNSSPSVPKSKKTIAFVLFGTLFVAFFAASFVEQSFRLNNPKSVYRPTNALSSLYEFLCQVYETIGYYLGYALDIFTLIKEILKKIRDWLPIEDATALAKHNFTTFVVPPWYSVKGFFAYYGKYINIEPPGIMLGSAAIAMASWIFLVAYERNTIKEYRQKQLDILCDWFVPFEVNNNPRHRSNVFK
jgi:hypothetical protein